MKKLLVVFLVILNIFNFSILAFAENLPPLPAGSVVTASSYITNFGPTRVYDGSLTNQWASTLKSGWLDTYLGGVSHRVTSYTIVGINVANMSPKDWTLKGSNDGINYNVIDTVTGEINWPTNYTGRSFTVDNPSFYKYYRIDVSANNGGTYLEIGEIIYTYNDSTEPTKITNLHATRVNHQYVTLAWDGTPLADGYYIYRDGVNVGTVNGSSVVTYQDNGLIEGTNYTYEVSGFNSIGEGLKSDSINVTTQITTDTTPPGVVQNFRLGNITNHSILVDWSANTDIDFASYSLYLNGVLITDLTSDFTSYTFDGLVSDTQYNIIIKANDFAGNQSTGSVLNASTLEGIPPAPVENVGSTSTNNSVTLTWPPNTDSDLAGYKIIVDGVVIATLPPDATFYTINDLQPNSTYSVGVITYDVNGNESNVVSKDVSTTFNDNLNLPLNISGSEILDVIGMMFNSVWGILALLLGIAVCFVVVRRIKGDLFKS